MRARSHADTTTSASRSGLPRIVELLIAEGWRHAPGEDRDGGTGYERAGVRLKLTDLVCSGDGHAHTRR
jgi:hypothetical protein